MSEFEFLVSGTSIVVALSIAKLLEGLRDSFETGRRYWLHALWVVNKFVNAILIFWTGFEYRLRTDYGFGDFLLLFAGPAILFLQAHTLVSAHPDAVHDWKTHFWSVRRWFFAANIVYILTLLASLVRLNAVAVSAVGLLPFAIVLGFSITGLVSQNERVHGAIAIVASCNLALGFAARLFMAG